MSEINLNGGSKKIILNGTTYYAGGSNSGGGSSTLITKTITANGTYSAQDDNADGYSEVNVNVANPSFTKVASGIQPITAKSSCVWNTNAPLDFTDIISGYVSYNSSTKEIEVLKDFDATLVPWVKAYYGSSSENMGKLLINGTSIIGFNSNSSSADTYSTAIVPIHLSEGDVITIMATNQDYKTHTSASEPGWPGVGIDIYVGSPSATEYRQLDKATTGDAYQFLF